MEHDHRRGGVHQLQSVHPRHHGRIRRQRLARLCGADAAARAQVDRHPAEGARPGADDRHRLRADAVPCIKAARDGAITKRDDGIVIIDPVKAKGQKQLVDACPYGHIWWNDELNLPQHWPFDAHLIDQGWQQTRGQQSCPTGAMKAIKVEDADMERMAREQGLERMKPELGTRPRVWYRNLWRYTKCFIGGSVSAEQGGVVDCVEGAKVRLVKDGRAVAETATDNYGDFKFDRLDENSGVYTVEIEAPGRAKKTVAATLGASVSLGEIRV